MTKFGEYGFYSMDFKLKNNKSVPTGSKIIAYNTTSCDELNINLMSESNRTDPGNQFYWLEQELAAIEGAGGLAILIGHIDPATCMHEWGTRFRALTERY